MAAEYEYEVTEWWDHSGEHHAYSPIAEQLEHDAVEVTVHITYYDDNGNVTSEKYIDLYSDDGWVDDELDGEVDDAADYYEE